MSHDHISMPSLPMQLLLNTTCSIASFGHRAVGLDPMPTRFSNKDQRPNVYCKDSHGTTTRTAHTIHAHRNYLQLGRPKCVTVTSTHSSGHTSSSSVWSSLGQACRVAIGPLHACSSLHALDVFVQPEVCFVTSYAYMFPPIICMSTGTLRPL